MIDQKLVADLFVKMRQATNWNLEGTLLWGYYFTAADKKPLMKLAGKLREVGYRYVGFIKDEIPDGEVLHVEKVEVHSPSSLNHRNVELSKIAQIFGCNYDGFDVGMPPVGRKKRAAKTQSAPSKSNSAKPAKVAKKKAVPVKKSAKPKKSVKSASKGKGTTRPVAKATTSKKVKKSPPVSKKVSSSKLKKGATKPSAAARKKTKR